MQKAKLFLLIAFLSVLTGCVTQKKCNTKFPPSVQRDSVYIETIKEIPVILPGDTVNVEVPINCPDQDIIKLENSKLKQQISIIKGKLISNTTIKPDTVFIHSKETKTVTKEVKVSVPEKFIPKIYKQSLMICIVIFAGAFLFIGYKAYSFFKK